MCVCERERERDIEMAGSQPKNGHLCIALQPHQQFHIKGKIVLVALFIKQLDDEIHPVLVCTENTHTVLYIKVLSFEGTVGKQEIFQEVQ